MTDPLSFKGRAREGLVQGVETSSTPTRRGEVYLRPLFYKQQVPIFLGAGPPLKT